ncbi:DMT family transporter [Microvirga aerophila]|uniref:DMT transporter permease n=1 Tax=Microvirga aerophila TaxID=670291 RepID=A0A512C1K8_9HYPH|nr:DMT family transporter [Microvirga aerophila]GEO18106.1 DMT transporter permease [Microvirga aerophila]
MNIHSAALTLPSAHVSLWLRLRARVDAARQTPLWGIALIVTSTVFFACSDVITKALASSLPAVEITWLRYVTFSLLILPLLLRKEGGTVLRSRRPGLQVLRGLGMAFSALLFISSLRFLPVADATAINFISPILITALSIPFLGEVVGWRRWTAAIVGLMGVLIVIRPGTSSFELAAVLPLLGATCWAGAAIATRMMRGTDSSVTTLSYSAFVGAAVLSALVPFGWVTPSWPEISLGVCVGVLSTIGHWLVILAYRHASASTIAPFSYVQLLWAGALGYAAFGSMPDLWTVVGIAIIAASGLYTAYRERMRARLSAQAQLR